MEQTRPIGYWLKLVDGLISTQFDTTLEEHGVTRRQWQILNLLAEKPATPEELDAELGPFLEQAEETLAEHLAELTESNWLDQDNGRYSLAELGRSSMRVLGDVVGQDRERIIEGIAPEDYETTVSALEAMAKNLGWSGGS